MVDPTYTAPLLVTVKEAMATLRLGRTSIFALCAAGDSPDPGQHLKRVRIGRASRITRESVLALAGQLEKSENTQNDGDK